MKVKAKSKKQKSKIRNFKFCNLQFAICNSERGFVLIASLLLLLVATVVGITALQTSTTNVMIAGNQRLSEINFSAADSGVSVSVPIIDNTAYSSAVSNIYASLVINPNFVNEISGALPDITVSPDLQFSVGSGASAVTVSVDIEYLYSGSSAGGAMEFASGYEGLGKGAGTGGTEIYYSINSSPAGAVGSQAQVDAVYRYLTK